MAEVTGRLSSPAVDVMAVCLNGHKVTDRAQSRPFLRANFCEQCGAKVIETCPKCGTSIPGARYTGGAFTHPSAPNNCHACGTAYPWRQQALASAVELARMQFENSQEEEVAGLLHEIAIDTPKTELSAHKFKRLMVKLGKPGADIVRGIVVDIGAEAAKKIILG